MMNVSYWEASNIKSRMEHGQVIFYNSKTNKVYNPPVQQKIHTPRFYKSKFHNYDLDHTKEYSSPRQIQSRVFLPIDNYDSFRPRPVFTATKSNYAQRSTPNISFEISPPHPQTFRGKNPLTQRFKSLYLINAKKQKRLSKQKSSVNKERTHSKYDIDLLYQKSLKKDELQTNFSPEVEKMALEIANSNCSPKRFHHILTNP